MKKVIIVGLLTSSTLWASPYDDARKAAAHLGVITHSQVENSSCGSCHNVQSARLLQEWADQTSRVTTNCLNQITPTDTIECLKDGDQIIKSEDLGMYSLAIHQNEFKQLFVDAYGVEEGINRHSQASSRAGMPLGHPKLDKDDINLILSWMNDSLPYLNRILPPSSGPNQCEASITPKLKSHIFRMQFQGWAARNQDNNINMFACAYQNPLDCFKMRKNGKELFPLASQDTFVPTITSSNRVIHEFAHTTDYWIRSSADGRFVAYGGSPSYIVDLRSKITSPGQDRLIEVNAYYDPSFFPDNSAFMFQGSTTGICQQSLLEDLSISKITFDESSCSFGQGISTPLYQAVGTSLDLDDYLAVTGSFESDPGFVFSNSPNAEVAIHPFIFDGNRWEKQDPTTITTPWEMDWNISPSNKVLISRVVNAQYQHNGYHLYTTNRLIDNGQYHYEIDPLGSICTPGLKGKFSFDERFFVSYAYVKQEEWKELGYRSPEDPEFTQLLSKNASSILLTDLLSGKSYRLNKPVAGVRLMFPHFRSDGWIYFMMHHVESDKRTLIASDAALRIAF